VPATGIRLRHEYAKHAFYDTWTQVHRRLFYNPQSFDAHSKEPLRISLMYLTFLETRIIQLTVCVCLHSIFFGGRRNFPQDFSISKRGAFRPFKVIEITDIGANRKRICDFLLVRNTNLGPILHHFGARTRFMCSCPYSILILGVFPLHQIAHVGRQRAHVP